MILKRGLRPLAGRKCPWEPKYLPTLTFTRDRFRVKYWVRCWTCDLKLGPFEMMQMANWEIDHLLGSDEQEG